MSQTKAQLVAPIGVVTASGVVASGVVTASSFDAGSVTGTATSIIEGSNLNVGIMSATSFVGDFTGSATGITTGSDIKVGAFTASSFTGDFTGTATSMMRGTGFEAGAVNATGFVANVVGDVTGNATGLAASVTSGANIHVGVMTATSWHGDGGSLTGIAATNFNTQTVTTDSSETIIDLADGNCITMNQAGTTTVGFASTSSGMDVTLIRIPFVDYNVSYATGGVDFDGTGDYLSLADSDDFDMGTGDFTVECWINLEDLSSNRNVWTLSGYDTGGELFINSNGLIGYYVGTGFLIQTPTGRMTAGKWYHLAVTRASGTARMFIDGTEIGSAGQSGAFPTSGTSKCYIGAEFNGAGAGTGTVMKGEISNFRVVKGTAVYTSGFTPPSAALTNITGTVLLCCQSDSSTTTGAVTPGTITANGDPTAGAQTISLSGITDPDVTITWPDSVKWNGGGAPTLISAATTTSERQQFQFITGDTGLNWYAWENFKDDPLNLQLFSWGANVNNGQLGQNDRTDRSSPTQIGTEGNWQAASSHSTGGAAIKSNGTLWAWGEGSSGQLAQNNTTAYSSPVQVGGNKNWKSLQWGNNTCWGLTNPGTMYVWGINPAGQFGSGNVTPASSPLQIGESGVWSSIQQAGNGTGAAVKKAGGLWRWGANNNGELGMNSRTYYSSPIQIGSGTWKSFGGGTSYNIAVDGDGKLWAMGRNNVGNIGQNSSTARFSSPVQIGTGSDWASVSGGRYWCAALKTDGSLYAWGVNDKGQLGQNSRLPSDNTGYSSPAQIPGTWSHIRGQNGGFFGGKSDGTLWGWGGNYNGGLGQNDESQSLSSPTQIPGTWNVANTSYYAQANSMVGLKVP